MIALTTVASGPSGVRKVRISLPLVELLLDNQRYFRESDLPAASGEDLRPLSRPKVHKVLGTDARPDKPERRGPVWTSHDHGKARRRRRDREEAELADS